MDKIVTLKLTGVQQGDSLCTNFEILSWEALNDCTFINCIIGEDKKTLKIQQLEDCEDSPCVRIWVKCNDCSNCPLVPVDRCLCENIDDCEVCEVCTSGVCIPKCPDLCDPDTNDCVDCIENTDCVCNQECVQGNCVCPVDKPILNTDGCCVECLNDAGCDICEQCVSGACVPKDCLCNPNTGACVECLTGEDCEGDNECCVGNRCTCCPGYILVEGVCVEEPECVTEEDCPACQICVGGDCVDLVCPDGRVCVDGDCVPECDCANPNCTNPNQVCINRDLTTCYCSTCSGPCDNSNPCGEGCVCVGGTCVVNPCFGPCNTGDNCGPGCGCLNGECIKCDSVSCVTSINCPIGCFCNGSTCSDVDGPDDPGDPNGPCTNELCSNPANCGVNCTCINGRCVPCSSLSCITTECANTPGCACAGSSCAGDPEGPGECTNVLAITKIEDECDLKGTLTTTDCCQCEDQAVGFVPLTATAGSSGTLANVRVQVQLKRGITANNSGSFGALPLLSALNIDNVLPTSGTIPLRLNQVLRVYAGGQFTGNSTTDLPTVYGPSNAVFSSTDTVTVTFTNAYRAGVDIAVGSTTYRVYSQELTFLTSTSNIVHVNKCQYRFTPSSSVSLDTDWAIPATAGDVPNAFYNLNKVVLCRDPLFTWRRSDSPVASTIIRRVYAPLISGAYTDTLTGPTLLYGSKAYGLDSDCGCDPSVEYSCYGPGGTPTVVTFCDPDELDFELSNCGRRITFLSDHEITCDAYTGAEKPTYQLLFNGVVVLTRVLPVDNILFDEDEIVGSTDFPEPITLVQLRIVGDVCNECTLTYPVTNPIYEASNFQIVSPACDDESTLDFSVIITGGQAPYSWELTRNGEAVVGGSGTFVSAGFNTITGIANASGTYLLTIEDANGCFVEVSLSYNLANITDNVTAAASCTGSNGSIVVTNPTGATVNVLIVGGVVNLNTTAGPGNTPYPVPNGTYTVTISSPTDGLCTNELEVIVACCNSALLSNVFFISYDCAVGGITYAKPAGATVTYDGDALVNGDFIPGGNQPFQVSAPGCSPITVNWDIPYCYNCDEEDGCLQASPVNTGTYTGLSACQLDCNQVDPPDTNCYTVGIPASRVTAINGVTTFLGSNGFSCSGGLCSPIGSIYSEIMNTLIALGDPGTANIGMLTLPPCSGSSPNCILSIQTSVVLSTIQINGTTNYNFVEADISACNPA